MLQAYRPIGGSIKAAIVVCLLAVVGLGLYPRPLVDEAMRAATSFLGGG